MNKAELIEKAAEASGLSKTDTTAALNAILSTVQAAVAKGDNVTLIGFGSFKRIKRKGGERRNPHGGTVVVPERLAPTFKAGADFKKVVAA